MLTPYQFASNTPIQAIDLDGLEAFRVTNRNAAYTNGNNYNRILQNVAYMPNRRGVDGRGEWEYFGVRGIGNGVYNAPQFVMDQNIGNYLVSTAPNDLLNYNKGYDISLRGQRINNPTPPPPPPPPSPPQQPKLKVKKDKDVVKSLPKLEEPVSNPPTLAAPEFEIKTHKLDIEFRSNRASFKNQSEANNVLKPLVDLLLEDPRNSITLIPRSNLGAKQDQVDLWGLAADGDKIEDLVKLRGNLLRNYFLDKGVQESQIDIIINENNFNKDSDVIGTVKQIIEKN